MRTYTGIWLDRRKASVATLCVPETFVDTVLKTTIVECLSMSKSVCGRRAVRELPKRFRDSNRLSRKASPRPVTSVS